MHNFADKFDVMLWQVNQMFWKHWSNKCNVWFTNNCYEIN